MDKLVADIPSTLNTSDNCFTTEFYEPCLKWAKTYDRGVGYFTSSWISVNSRGMSHFAASGGRARWLTSPILSEKDQIALINGLKKPADLDIVNAMRTNVEELSRYLESETRNALGWMIYDGIIEIRFAFPTSDLEGGDFHDKFGIFSDARGNYLSFNGSVNDSRKGTVNYESIKVFKSWSGMHEYVQSDIDRFERLWNNQDKNLAVHELPEVVKNDLFNLRSSQRPYPHSHETQKQNKWKHQDAALERFLEVGNGILEMATGTGKTRTALKIVSELLNRERIRNVIITVKGTDLLDQWYKEICKNLDLPTFRHYERYKELSDFLISPTGAVLLISRDFIADNVNFIQGSTYENTIIICDEVHGMGSPSLVKGLKGKISPFKYRLGLSATPERDYDEEGNRFIANEIGEVIFEFGLEKAIKRGILCEFDYHPLSYELTDGDRDRIRRIIKAYNAKKAKGEFVRDEDLYRDIALVRKVSRSKLPVFQNFLQRNPDILDRSIIFVETKEYGEQVQNLIIRHLPNYHTYYGEDDRVNLVRFSRGELSCLITSKRISEGIDIKSVKNIILFSADKARIQTIQRIGRSLRIEPNNPGKRAAVIDFIESNDSDDEKNTDKERECWLRSISEVKKEEAE